MLVEDDSLRYTVQYSERRRTVALHIKDGQLLVKAPADFALVAIAQLVAAKRGWVEKHLKHSKMRTKPDWLTLGRAPLLGSELQLIYQRDSRSYAEQSEHALLLSVSTRVSSQRYEQVLLTQLTLWYQQQAQQWFNAGVLKWQKVMQLQPGAVYIGNWRSKWGYCKQNGDLGFNWRLLMAPHWVAEYVIVHELAHLKHMNHSAQFWQLVGVHFPEYKAAQLWLKQNAYWMDI